ncbi:hypothetical protein XENOCAPTIV_023165 [Xenoophorus captivus]|uniref:Uncharacterized protein n=1 Tax=Xenoophorus captivus TaxID=1517983 RepID=A0ABV0RJ71_9TELE
MNPLGRSVHLMLQKRVLICTCCPEHLIHLKVNGFMLCYLELSESYVGQGSTQIHVLHLQSFAAAACFIKRRVKNPSSLAVTLLTCAEKNKLCSCINMSVKQSMSKVCSDECCFRCDLIQQSDSKC